MEFIVGQVMLKLLNIMTSSYIILYPHWYPRYIPEKKKKQKKTMFPWYHSTFHIYEPSPVDLPYAPKLPWSFTTYDLHGPNYSSTWSNPTSLA
jgi:hypothetical protein